MPSRSTSLAARSSPRPAAKHRLQVFTFVLKQGDVGATLNEIEAALDLSGNTVRPRRLELERKNLIIASGKHRATPSGRLAIVWEVPPGIRIKALAKMIALGLS